MKLGDKLVLKLPQDPVQYGREIPGSVIFMAPFVQLPKILEKYWEFSNTLYV